MPKGVLPSGRPDHDAARYRARLNQLLRHVTSDDDVLAVWDHVTDMAKNSTDIQWASLFLAYTLGKPQPVDPGTASIVVEGNVQLNQLSIEQVQAIAALKQLSAVHGTYTTVEPQSTPDPD